MVIGIVSQITDTFVSIAPYMMMGLFFAGVLHVFIDRGFILRHLGGNDLMSVVKAAIFGIPLPLCSCGVLPVAMSLRKGKASNGATVSFLISTPQTGIDSIIATWGMLGPVFAVFRPIAAFMMGIFGGLATNLVSSKSMPAPGPVVKRFDCNICCDTIPHSHSFARKIKSVFSYAYFDFFDDISANLAIGIVISGVIAFFVPDNFFQKYIGNEILSMLLMIGLGIPMYTCVTASIPIAVALMFKGLSPGAAFVFLTVGPATNVSFILVIAKAMGKKIVTVYLATLAVMSMTMGLALNAVYSITGKQSLDAMLLRHFCRHTSPVELITSGIFLIIIIMSFYRLWAGKLLVFLGIRGAHSAGQRICSLDIQGMTCKNCAKKITESLKKVPGVTSVDVDLGRKKATIAGTAGVDVLKKAIGDAGYTTK